MHFQSASACTFCRPSCPSPRFVHDHDMLRSCAGPTQKPQLNAVSTPGKFFGATEFGFSKKNEVRMPNQSPAPRRHCRHHHLKQTRALICVDLACPVLQVLVGRTAQLGFLAAVIGEKITGLGPLRQFGLETGAHQFMASTQIQLDKLH